MKESKINSLVGSLAKQVLEESLKLKAPSPPLKEKQKDYNSFMKQIETLRGRPLFYPYIGSGLGRGALVQLLDGSVKIDLISGIGVHILGHSHPAVLQASLLGATEDIVMQGHLQNNLIYKKFLEKIISLASKNSRLKQGWISPSGSMANENGLKIIRQKKQGARFLMAFERAFAGRTTMMAEITDNPKFKEGLPSYNEILRIPFCPEDPNKALNVLKSHYEKYKQELAGFMVEFMQGDGGYYLAKREFFLPLFEFCKEKKIAIWADEVQTFARSGEFFAYETLNLGDYIDVCTIGKSLQSSVTLYTEEYNPKPGLVSGTFAGSSSSLHAGLAILNTLDAGYMGPTGKISKIHKRFTEGLRELEKEGLVSDIEGWGLMIGVTPFNNELSFMKKLLQKLFEKGLILFYCGKGQSLRLRFLIPADVDNDVLNQSLKILKETLLELKQ